MQSGDCAGASRDQGRVEIMSNLAKLPAALDLIESKIDTLTADQMHAAMIRVCNHIAPSFGKGWVEFRTWHFAERADVRDPQKVVYDPCTKDQLMAMVANKRAMLAAHPYVAA